MLCNGCLQPLDAKFHTLMSEEIIAFRNLTQVSVQYGKQVKLCWECKAIFKKCLRFIECCHKSDERLRFYNWQIPSLDTLYLDRERRGLLSRIDICILDDKPIIYEHLDVPKPFDVPIKSESESEDDSKFIEVFVNNTDNEVTSSEVEAINTAPAKRIDTDDSNDQFLSEFVSPRRRVKKTKKKLSKSVDKLINEFLSRPKKLKKLTRLRKAKEKSALSSKENKDDNNSNTFDDKYVPYSERRKFNPDYVIIKNLSIEEQREEFAKRKLDKKFLNCKFKCEMCFKGFSTQLTYDNHFRFNHHESIGELICELCGTRRKNKRKMYIHVKMHSTAYICKQCNFVSSCTGQAKRHEEIHQGKKFQCEKCGSTFTHAGAYYTHVRTMHSTALVCEVCGENFVSNVGLQLHRNKVFHHKPFKAEGPYCDLCEVTFVDDKAYKRHLECTDKHNEKTENGKSLVTQIRKYKKRKPRKLPLQFKKQSEKKDIPCEECGKIFANERAWNAHNNTVHLGIKVVKPKKYMCSICSNRFTTTYSLRVHQNSAHNDAPMYPCDLCERKYKTPTALVVHKNSIHNGIKYKCYFCVREYTTTAALSYHIKTLHFNQKMPPRNRSRKKIVET